ncbi:hypothetical protein MMC30_002179 [Trapelia coarctata]|nr:hypothetical protein [Trapelia coarctata]
MSYENEHLLRIEESSEEADRLEAQHQVLNIVFDNRLVFPPLSNPQSVLDLGYGAASWAVEVADTYPDCEVIGVDISPHMKPDDAPENFWPQLDDLNEPFTFESNRFDLVHSRLVGSGINKRRWPSYIRDILRVLKPNGWVQLVDYYFMCQSDNGSIDDTSALRQWSTNYIRALDATKDPRSALQLQNMFSAAGLVDVETRPREQRIGIANGATIQQALGSLSLFPFTRLLGMEIEEYEDLIRRARIEAQNPALKAYFPL